MDLLEQEQSSKRDSTVPNPRSSDKCSRDMDFQKNEPRKSNLKCNNPSRSRRLNVKWSVAKKNSSGFCGPMTYIQTCQSTSATSSCHSAACSDSNSWTASECDEITVVGKDGSTSKYINKTKIRRKSKRSSKDNHRASDSGEGCTKTKTTQHCITTQEKPSRGDHKFVKTKESSTKMVDKALLKALALHCATKLKENDSKKSEDEGSVKSKGNCSKHSEDEGSMKSKGNCSKHDGDSFEIKRQQGNKTASKTRRQPDKCSKSKKDGDSSEIKKSDGEHCEKSNPSSTVHKHKKIVQHIKKKKGERNALQLHNVRESKKSDGEGSVTSNVKCGKHKNILQRITEKDGRVVSKVVYIASSVSSCVSDNDDGCTIKKYKRLKRRRISRKSSRTATSDSGACGSRITTDGYDSERSCTLQPIAFIPSYFSHHQNPGEYYPMPMFHPYYSFYPHPYMPPFQQAMRTESSHSYYSDTSGEIKSSRCVVSVSSNSECSDNKVEKRRKKHKKKSKNKKFGSSRRSIPQERYTCQYSYSEDEYDSSGSEINICTKVDEKNDRFCDALQEVQKQRAVLKKKLAKMGLNVEEKAECLKRFGFDFDGNYNDKIESFQSLRNDISEENLSDCNISKKKTTTTITPILKSCENISEKERRILNEKEDLIDFHLDMDDYGCEPLNEVLAFQAAYYESVSRAKELKQNFINAMDDVEECEDLYKAALQEVHCTKKIYKKALEKLGVPWLNEDDDLESVEEIEQRRGRKSTANCKVGDNSMFPRFAVRNPYNSIEVCQPKPLLINNYMNEKAENTLNKLQCFVSKMNQNLPVFNQFLNELNNAEAKRHSPGCTNEKTTTVKKTKSILTINDGNCQEKVSKTNICIKTSTTNCADDKEKKNFSAKCCPTFCEQQALGEIIVNVQKPQQIVKRVTSRMKVYKTKKYHKKTLNPSEGVYFDKLTEFELTDEREIVYADQRENVCREGKEETKDRFRTDKIFTGFSPLLARLEYDQFESLTPRELYGYVHNCHLWKNFDINTAIKILDEWKKGRTISNDECLFAVHKPVTYLKLCGNKPALGAAIKTWSEYFKPSLYKRRSERRQTNRMLKATKRGVKNMKANNGTLPFNPTKTSDSSIHYFRSSLQQHQRSLEEY